MKKMLYLSFIFLSINCFCMDSDDNKQHSTLEMVAEVILSQISGKTGEEYPAIANNPYKNKTAYVTQNENLSKKEQNYLAKRGPVTQTALYKLLNLNGNTQTKPLTIACIFSGGGYRAMLGCLGSLRGLEKIGLMECITYLSTLSGSTWAVAPWLSTGMSLDEYTAYLHTCIEKPLYDMTHEEKDLLAHMIAVKKISKQKCTLVDIYGGLLGNRLLECMKDARHITSLSEQKQNIKDGSLPCPIYTAVSGDGDGITSWYTFTPDTVTNINYNVSIPTYGCGRQYNNGISTNNAPALPLSVLIATFGAAFAADWNTILAASETREPQLKELLDELKKLIKPIGYTRPIPCELKLPNFTKGLEILPLSDYKYLQLIDAGTDINLPYPPISGICKDRAADIMIFFDNSAGPIGTEFQKCVNFAKIHNLPFPPIDFEKINKKTCSIFTSNAPKTPLVIYLPGISSSKEWEQHKNNPHYKNFNLTGFDLKTETDQGFCKTQYFQYTRENACKVTYQTEFNIRIHAKTIKNAIKQKCESMATIT